MMTTNNIFATPRPQQFSLQYSVLQHVLKNCSAKTFQKLNQSCKYFYSKNSVAVWIDVEPKKFKPSNILIQLSPNEDFKLWIYRTVFTPKYLKLIPRIYRCQIVELFLENDTLRFDEFLLISETLIFCKLYDTKIYYDNDEIAPLEDIMATVPQAQKFYYYKAPFTPVTAYKLSILNGFKNLEALSLSVIPKNFNIDQFFSFLKKTKFCQGSLKFETALEETIIQNFKSLCCSKCYYDPQNKTLQFCSCATCKNS